MCEGKWVMGKWVNISIVRSRFLGMDALVSFHGTGDRMESRCHCSTHCSKQNIVTCLWLLGNAWIIHLEAGHVAFRGRKE